MTTLTKEQFNHLNNVVEDVITSLSEADIAALYSAHQVKTTFNFFFEGEDPKRPRHATVTKDGMVYDYIRDRRKAFPTLEAWHTDVLKDYPHMPLSALRFGQEGVFMLSAGTIESVLGWTHRPLTGEPPAPVVAPVPAVPVAAVPAPVAAPAAAPKPAAAGAGADDDFAAFEAALRKQVFAKFSTATSPEEILAAAEQADCTLAAKVASWPPVKPAPKKAAAPAPAPAPVVEDDDDDDEDMACLAEHINVCHIAADKGRRAQERQQKAHEAQKKAQEEEVAAAIVAVSEWLDQREIYAWAPNVEQALKKELPRAGLGDYLYIAKALLHS